MSHPKITRKHFLTAMGSLAASSLLLAGCATENKTSGSSSSAGSNKGKVKVVASTDVYADIAKQVGGDYIEVTALIASTSTDPHSYEATSADRLKAKDASLIVINGAGYDLFLEDLAGKDNTSQKIVNAVKVSGKLTDAEYTHLVEDHRGGEHHEDGGDHAHAHEFNEHLWYDFETMKKVAQKIAEELAGLDSAHAETFRTNASTFSKELDALDTTAKAIAGEGKKYLSTEPVPDYLISSTGAENATPSEFAEAAEAGNDVPALVLKETKDMITEKKVQLLAYNEQTSTSQTNEVLQAAKGASVNYVSFTETLPENTNYLAWMKTNVSNLEKALS